MKERSEKIQYLAHEFGPKKPRMRVRREWWMDDEFEVISYDDFVAFKAVAEALNVELEDLGNA